MSRARLVSRWASTVLAAIAWAGAAVSWTYFGVEAGIRPSFIFALSAAIAFTVVAAQCWALPHKAAREEHASIFALGFEHGRACAERSPLQPTPDESERHMNVVR